MRMNDFLKGIRDDTGLIADAFIDKYMVGLNMTNFDSMVPGLTDVIIYPIQKTEELIFNFI